VPELVRSLRLRHLILVHTGQGGKPWDDRKITDFQGSMPLWVNALQSWCRTNAGHISCDGRIDLAAKGKFERKSRKRWNEELAPLMLEQLQLANKIGHVAATSVIHRQSFASSFDEAMDAGEVGLGEHLVATDIPVNHAAFAIIDLFPKTPGGDRLRKPSRQSSARRCN
jgi:hypothetical protein